MHTHSRLSLDAVKFEVFAVCGALAQDPKSGQLDVVIEYASCSEIATVTTPVTITAFGKDRETENPSFEIGLRTA